MVRAFLLFNLPIPSRSPFSHISSHPLLKTPSGQIYRSTDSGATWSPLWDWGAYPEIHKYYSYHNDLAPWLGPNYVVTELGTLQIGWMMEALVIDPFDSDHWLYGTGATIYGGHDLTAVSGFC